MDDLELRKIVYRRFVETGTAPTHRELTTIVGDGAHLDRMLERLHDNHMLVLDRRPERAGEIRMALPFSAEATDFRVTTAGGAWWANCAWDSLAVVAALHAPNASISSHWSDTGEALTIDIVDGEIVDPKGYVHFVLPASQWWDDIVFT